MRYLRRNAIAIVALVFAMTGTGIAATHYIITSSSQISPSVLQQLSARAHAAEAKPAKKGARGIVARARGTGPVDSKAEETVQIPLTGSTWTQFPEELNEVRGQLTVTEPTSAACIDGTAAAVRVSIDGNEVAGVSLGAGEGGTHTLPLNTGPDSQMFEPAKATTRTLTATIESNCHVAHFTLDSLSVDVIGLR